MYNAGTLVEVTYTLSEHGMLHVKCCIGKEVAYEGNHDCSNFYLLDSEIARWKEWAKAKIPLPHGDQPEQEEKGSDDESGDEDEDSSEDGDALEPKNGEDGEDAPEDVS